MGKRNLQERDDNEAVEAGGNLLDKLLEAADKSLMCKGEDEGPVFNSLKENNDRHGKGWLALAFKESDESKDPDCIKRIVGEVARVILRVFHLLQCSRCHLFFFNQGGRAWFVAKNKRVENAVI
jgi:hypothetical protein